MNTANKYVCIHGHFYQPPRENAWLEVIELQDTAAPFHDWNDRINFECYAPNTAARILGEHDFIRKIVNNYTRISFNFGPTLLSWMEKADPESYRQILNADRISQAKFGGHGSALAQVHSHLILPLANRRDKETQIIWGIKDFEHRFQRKPEGMWLSETAADTETLEVLAENDIKFTILAPRQAKAIRKIGDKEWHELPPVSVEPRRPYLCKLPSGNEIVLFFYDGNVAQGVAFEGLLNNGKAFARRFVNAFDDNDEPQLVHIATDGESYGHHHDYGEMALADCLNQLEEQEHVTVTNYGQYLELFPPTYEAQIHENSSWSCVHGVERWRSNCGCTTGEHESGKQEWRAPLRNTLNWVRDSLIPIYEKESEGLISNPWQARNEYIEVLLQNRDEATIDKFIEKHAPRELNADEKTKMLRLLEMQRQTMLMFTSCGWFFGEVSRIETNQILQYANRAIYYARQVDGVDLHDEFIERLKEAPSNAEHFENAADSYRANVMPARVDLERVGMHYAASSLFEEYPEKLSLFNYLATSEDFERFKAGMQRLVVGRTVVKSRVTHSEKLFSFAVLYLGQQNMIGNISTTMSVEEYGSMKVSLVEAFRETNLSQMIGIMQEHFGSEKFSIWSLFQDEKRKILRQITEQSLEQADLSFQEIYNDNYQLMTSMLRSGVPIPKVYRNAIEYVVNRDLHHFFEQDFLFIRELQRLEHELTKWKIELLDPQSFTLAAGERIFYEIRKIAYAQVALEHLTMLNTILETLSSIESDLGIWKSQNLYFSMLKEFRSGKRQYLSEEWKKAFLRLGELLKVKGE